MPKTNFVDGDPSQGILGTVVTADFINTLNKHYHTGLDQDGHGALPYADDVGTADAYVVNLNPPLLQYVSGMPIFFKAASTNTGPATVKVNTLGVIPIKKNTGQDLAAGDIQAGQIVMVMYDGANFQLVGGLDAHTVDGYHASQSPGAGQIPVLSTSSVLALPNATHTVDGNVIYHAGNVGVANSVATTDANNKIIQIANQSDNKTARGATVYHSANQTVPTNSQTTLTWDTEHFNTDGVHSISVNPSRLNVPVGVSKVKVGFSVYISGGGATGYIRLRVEHPAMVFPKIHPPGAVLPNISIPGNSSGNIVNASSGVINVDPSGDGYFMFHAYQNSGSSVTIWGGIASSTFFWLEIIQ